MALSKGVREILTLLVVFVVLVGGLALYTRSWPPAVIVESGSMMHPDSDVTYGRYGTIDPGDLVLVKKVTGLDDITTLVEDGRDRYGKAGDVIVYYKGNDRGGTPIIHRAVAYVEIETGPVYFVRWSEEGACEGGATKIERNGQPWCEYGAEGILIPSVPVRAGGSDASARPYRPTAPGFITKGDNPATNGQIDPLSLPGVSRPIPLEWVEGKARAELPWLGLIKLALAGKPNQDMPPDAWVKIGSAYAPKDLWVMLGVSLFLLVGAPMLYDGYRAFRRRREAEDNV